MRRVAGMFLSLLSLGTALAAQTLHVYGPGGPVDPMRGCAALFTAETHVPVIVTAGPEREWIGAAQADADVVYGGAEYMLTQFGLDHPGFLLPGSRVELYPRAAGILVRPGNPRHIASLADLTRPGMHLLDVNGAGQEGLWEDLAGRKGLIEAYQRNIALTVRSSAEAVQAWAAQPELDAWLTFASWHQRMPETTELVRLPQAERIYRGTPIAVAQRSAYQAQANAFLRELQSAPCHAIFRSAGWQ